MRGLVVGTGGHRPPLPGIPAAAATVTALGRALAREAEIETLLDPAGPVEFGEAVAAAAEDCGDVFLFSFTGHGLITRSGALHLATAMTDPRPSRIEHTAFPYATLRRYLLASPARTVVVLLDCCFSGRAVGTLSGPEEIADLAQIDGGFVLASTGRNELAMAEDGSGRTVFGGALIDLLERGDPDGPELLTLEEIHRHLARTLPAGGFPRPRARAQGRAGELVLARNRRFRPAVPAPAAPAPAGPEGCPYKGLAPYGGDDAALFFGRDTLITTLVGAVATQPGPLLVTGASGSGKTSLLTAGLLPAIARGELGIPGSAHWPRHLIRPGDPLPASSNGPSILIIDQFEETFTRGDGEVVEEASTRGDGEVAEETFTRGDGEVAAETPTRRDDGVAEETSTRGDGEVAEEAFTRGDDGVAEEAFARGGGGVVEEVVRRAGVGGLIVLAVRADFLGRCAEHPVLRRALAAPFVVGPMDEAELREAVERPAAAAGLSVEDGLTELLLSDLGSGPGRLPLLSHALRATWERRAGRTLTFAGYRAAGA
ncbi:caspase, EACC1-associated type, partial [Actinocorallia lasiicapitis]